MTMTLDYKISNRWSLSFMRAKRIILDFPELGAQGILNRLIVEDKS